MQRIGVLSSHVSAGGRLQGKNAVVTGAGSGIGRATSLLYAKEGASVVCSDVNKENVEETVRLIKEAGGVAVAKPCDVSDAQQVEDLMELCTSKFGSIDICYANAGIALHGPFWEETPETFNKTFQVNVTGVFNCFKSASVRMMKAEKGGSLIATASVAGLASGAGDASYSASKAAVVNLCRVIANQLTGTNIRCNAICPGLIETGMTSGLFHLADAKGFRNKIGQINPMMRYGNPDEIATVALFLASSDSSYVNGQAIPVCGGLTSSHPVARRGKGLSS